MDNGPKARKLELVMMPGTPTAESRLRAVQTRIAQAAAAAGRAEAAVRLLAVSKTFDAVAVRDLAACGQRDFGENYVQEALDKQTLLVDLPLLWHFIGPIQSNKTRAIAENFSWVHSVDRMTSGVRCLDCTRPPPRHPVDGHVG